MKIVYSVALLCTSVLVVINIATATTDSRLRSEFWNRFVGKKFANEIFQQQQQEDQVCPVAPRTYSCQSARLVVSRTKHTYIHVCPKDSSAQDVCFNTKLRRCCPQELATSQWTCLSTTTLKVSGQTVVVKIHQSPDAKEHCIAFDGAHQDTIRSCCFPHTTGLEECGGPPKPPTCVKNQDLYFVLDSTDSVDDAAFCRFGYILQLIVAAVNPRGPRNGPRVATVLFHHSSKYRASFLFNLDDQCSKDVDDNIRRVVYEYYGVKNLGLRRENLEYPNVRALTTLPFSALDMVDKSIEANGNRRASVITLTDGKSHQSVKNVVDKLRRVSDPLIAAGIGADVDVPYLVHLASNSSTVVYEPNRDNAISLGIKIVEIMRDTAALCPEEANKILASLNAATESNLDEYCSRCMWRTNSQMTPDEQQECSARTPTCGGNNLKMQAFQEQKMEANVGEATVDKQHLEEEILAAIDQIMRGSSD